MIRHLIRNGFGTSRSKYFLDDKYQNVSIESGNKLGSLYNVTNTLKQNNVNMVYIKSHFSNAWTNEKKYCLDISIERQPEQKLQELKQKFSDLGKNFNIEKPIKVPWFPRDIQDLNLIGKVLLKVKDQINKDHPQFTDKQYRKRRDFIAEIALKYQMGQPITDIPYTQQETNLWRRIYEKLRKLHKRCMSKRYEVQLQKLQKQFMFSKRIPQLNQLNAYLNNKTGFSIKPTHGILSQREFLNCFAFRVFCCTQYLRNTGTPDYTPQPDIVHEIVGHVPMFADPDVAQLSQQIGLLSLGATDQQVAQLGTLYWYTLQFGACLEGDKKLGYGAGIASSIAQAQNLLKENTQFVAFNPFNDHKVNYPIQTVQQSYRVTETFEKALNDLQHFGKQITKPMTTTFNFQTKTIDYDRNIEGIDQGDKPIEFM